MPTYLYSMFEVLVGVGLLATIILIHELGHYVAARLIGVRVITFSVGFGKRIWEKRIGDTLWCLSALPLGGYVRPFHDKEQEKEIEAPRLYRSIAPLSGSELEIFEQFKKEKRGNLENASFLGKLFFMTNGLIFNVLSAYLVLAFGSYLLSEIRMPVLPPTIGLVKMNSPASEAGLQRGDRILKIDGTPVTDWAAFSEVIQNPNKKSFLLTIDRQGVELESRYQPQKNNEDKFVYGFRAARELRSPTLFEALKGSALVTPKIAVDFVKAAIGIEDEKDKSDPDLSVGWGFVGSFIGIGVFASESIKSFVSVFIVISMAIVILNAVPYPAFDGCHILILLLEKIRGSEFSFEAKHKIGIFGLTSSFALVVIALGGDIYTSLSIFLTG